MSEYLLSFSLPELLVLALPLSFDLAKAYFLGECLLRGYILQYEVRKVERELYTTTSPRPRRVVDCHTETKSGCFFDRNIYGKELHMKIN